jgi:autotransporter-associated beta strand protein
VPEGIAIVRLPASGYTAAINSATPLSNVRLPAGTHTLTASRTINSLILDPGATLNGVGATLTISSGAAMFGEGGATALNVEALNLPTSGFLTVGAGGTAMINSTIVGAGTAIIKAGEGKLILAGDNQFGGSMNVNSGVLNIQRSSALGATAGATSIKQGAALEIEETTFGPVLVLLETLMLQGTGIGDTGALRNIAGSNSWAGNVALSAVTVDGASFFPSTNSVVASVAIIGVEAGRLDLSGVVSGNVELFKVGAGTLEFSGVASNTNNASVRVKEGTLLLNKAPGLVAIANTTFFVGDDDGIGAPAVLRLANSDQTPDGTNITVGSTGSLDWNGFNDAINALNLTIGPTGASSVTLGGGTLTLLGNLTVHSIGSGNPVGATITDGTLALALFGTTAGATRTFLVNDGTVGDDLTITAAIVDGSGLASMAVQKDGFGTLFYAGPTANTYTGTTTVREGELALAKPNNVNAFMGPLTIGDSSVQSGFAKSDVVRLRQHNQVPDYLAAVTIQNTGLLDLNGFNETIGNADAQTALTLNMGNVDTGTGTLSINGDIATTATQNTAGIVFTPTAPPR